jgi:hypothetical protein
MSPIVPIGEMPGDGFEHHARALLEESVTHIDGRIRSRLGQARHAAIAAASRPRSVFWRRFTLMPAAGAVAAAVLVAFVMWPPSHKGELPIGVEGGHTTVEDMDLLADSEALDLVSEGSDGAFYEWAAEQTETSANESST